MVSKENFLQTKLCLWSCTQDNYTTSTTYFTKKISTFNLLLNYVCSFSDKQILKVGSQPVDRKPSIGLKWKTKNESVKKVIEST